MVRVSRLASILALLLVLGFVAAACSSSDNTSSGGTPPSAGTPTSGESSEGGTITIGSDTANDHGTKDLTGQDETELELDNFYFEPTVLKGSPGAQIKLELTNEGSALHNFSLTEQAIDQDVAAGENSSVTVTFPQSGFLAFFCKYHRGSGMVGELITG